MNCPPLTKKILLFWEIVYSATVWFEGGYIMIKLFNNLGIRVSCIVNIVLADKVTLKISLLTLLLPLLINTCVCLDSSLFANSMKLCIKK